MENVKMKDVWSNALSMRYRGGEPLRPPAEASQIIYDLATSVLNKDSPKNEVVLLGVTPELALLPWPENVSLKAFDKSAEMIASVWESNPSIVSHVQQAHWQSIPLPEESTDLILGDGCTTQLPDEESYKVLFAELSRILKASSHLIMRCFIRPESKESLDQIIEDAYKGKIINLGTLKWRIAMANMAGNENHISVQAIHNAFNSAFPDRQKLMQFTGWPSEIVNTIDVYNGLKTHYTFPTLNELAKLAEPLFKVSKISYGNYELAERCPIVLFHSCKQGS